VALRDRALIAIMAYDFARIGAVAAMNVEEHYQQGKKWRFRFHEKGGMRRSIGIHLAAADALKEYVNHAGLESVPSFALVALLRARSSLTGR